jgi:hypothetical protein
MKRFFALLVFLAIASPLYAWGEAGHYIVNEAATLGLPTDMPHFFYRAYPDLVWLAYDPDRWKGSGPSSDAANEPEHYLDSEFLDGLTLPPTRYDYVHLAYTSGVMRRKGVSGMGDLGFLPWRIAELSEQLQKQFRDWRFSRPGSLEREALERDIIHTAGILGHYVGDAANPHHTTIHHNGWLDPNPQGFANDCQIHSRFESNFISHSVAVRDVTPKVAAPSIRTDYFQSALAFVSNSKSLVPELYRIDRAGGFDTFGKPPAQGVAFATDRLARGASMLRDLWWSAWRNSATSTRGRR